MSSRYLLLRLDAPLMSFGGVAVDAHGITEAHPTLSMLTGLLANAMGYEHGQAEALERLQERIHFGARRDVAGRDERGRALDQPHSAPLVDYQTVDLGQPHLAGGGWTSWGRLEKRAGAFSTGTHIRLRHYLADHVFLVALTLRPADEAPDVDDLARALRTPTRPLFLGRRCCLPSEPMLIDEVESDSLLSVLSAHPRLCAGASEAARLTCWLPVDEVPEGVAPVMEGHKGQWLQVADRRDWSNQVHTGRRWLRRLHLEVPHDR